MARRSPLDDPQIAAHAWLRFRRIMLGMLALTVLVVGVALWLVYRETGLVSVHFFIATALGIGLTMLLTSGLMGLIFLSSGTGHDESIESGESSDGRPGTGSDEHQRQKRP
jgi:hypothetical protein